jgi:hypothetical protein
MKPAMRTSLLRILASAAVNVCVYAVVVTLRASLFKEDGGLFALFFYFFTSFMANAAAFVFMGGSTKFASRFAEKKTVRFLAFMLNIKNGAALTSSAAAWMIILVPIGVTFLIHRQQGILRALFELLPVTIAYVVSLRHTTLSSYEIMSDPTAYTGFFMLALCLEIPLLISRLIYLRIWMFAATYIFIFAYLIIKNNEDIESNIYSYKHLEKTILPKNLRKLNTVTICVIFLVILLLFNLKTVVSTLLKWSATFILLIISWIAWLIDRLFPAGELITEGVGNAEPGLLELIPGPPNPVVNLIFNILKNFVLLYLAYRILLQLVKWVPALYRKIVGLIKKIFMLKKSEGAAEESDFIDETETIRPVSVSGEKRKAVRNAVKSIRDARREKDPVKRVRLMYSIILIMLPAIGVNPDRSDTTLEIIRKTSASQPLSTELSDLTDVYNRVRYGDERPGQERLAQAEEHFDKAVEVIRGR